MSLSLYHPINRKVYTKRDNRKLRTIIKMTGLVLFSSGLLFGGYFFFPFLSWQLYLAPVFASQSFAAPIPRTTIVTKNYIESLWLNTARSIENIYSSESQGWVPATSIGKSQITTGLSYYFISIPKIQISNAIVSTVDTDISSHLINFPGTSTPPEKGNSVIFGHSTLPQLFDPKNYKTIFANAHTLVIGDKIEVHAKNLTYMYKIYNISIVEADDTSFLAQETDDSYLTIVTCTPPGTLWKRLIIRARLEKI